MGWEDVSDKDDASMDNENKEEDNGNDLYDGPERSGTRGDARR